MKEFCRAHHEAARDWLPQRNITVETPLASCEGQVMDPTTPVLAIPILRAGLGLWAGGQDVLPHARVAHMGVVRDEATAQASSYLDRMPKRIGERVGVMVFDPMVPAEAWRLCCANSRNAVHGSRLRASRLGVLARTQNLARISGLNPVHRLHR